jgi:hypothetical protein
MILPRLVAISRLRTDLGINLHVQRELAWLRQGG